MNLRLFLAAAVVAVAALSAESAQAGGMLGPWHGGYYHSAYGTPVAVLVPHRARFHSEYHWGKPAATTHWIGHRFHDGRPRSSRRGLGRGLSPTPAWPSSTDQFGAYYVRAPRGY